MDWIGSLTGAISYVEDNLTEDLSVDDVARHVYTSSSHFQFLFHVVTGITIGEYIRNRRLSVAAQELISGSRIIDVAMRFQYDTQESFSKAFTRFHGVPPSKIDRKSARVFHPLIITVSVEGGFGMSGSFINEFYMVDWDAVEKQEGGKLSDSEKYSRIVGWAGRARSQNPCVFDELTEWILDDSQWTSDKLRENEQILMGGVFARFKEQNARLRACLKGLKDCGSVNPVVFDALNSFDEALCGSCDDERLRGTVSEMFRDFSVMSERAVREKIAGGLTGPTGTSSVELFGYINMLKDLDARVQWSLFMPDVVKNLQKDFRVESFEYKKLPAMRFIGQEGEALADIHNRGKLFSALDDMSEYNSDFGYDLLFMHHNGLGVDVGEWHGVWGRFMKAGAPVPEGFMYIDFEPEVDESAGPPYCSQFAFAIFSGDLNAMHRREGYDGDGMYDVTRNIILGQNVTIPYPGKYWTAEVFLDGYKQESTAYLFSVLK